MKLFMEQERVGTCRYVVSHHDGVKTNKDGSPFFDLAIFKNKRKKNQFVSSLKNHGYKLV